MVVKMKVKLRTCEICEVKKKVAEFTQGKICNKCQARPTLREESTDDETIIPKSPVVVPLEVIAKEIPEVVPNPYNDDLQRLHAKIDYLGQRFDRMETLVLGLMDLLGKINCEMEMKKVDE